MIIKKLEPGTFASNCYIVGAENNKEGMIIDPGAGAQYILKSVADLELNIKTIVLTHGHMDHIGALQEVKDATGAEVAIHKDDAQALQKQSPVTPDKLLKEGDYIDIGDLRFVVLHTPGHTAGGICLLEDKDKSIVFTGDTLFNFGIGRADFPGSSYEQELHSIRTQLLTLPDETIACPGHGPDTTIGTEREWNSFLRN